MAADAMFERERDETIKWHTLHTGEPNPARARFTRRGIKFATNKNVNVCEEKYIEKNGALLERSFI